MITASPATLDSNERRKLAHELRTSFGIILARVDVLLSADMSTHAAVHRNAYLEDIRLAANHALEVIAAVADDADNAVHDLMPATDLYDITKQALALVLDDADDAGVTIAMAALEEKIAVCAKAAALRQILLNILVNAIKFTPSGGMIEIDFAAASQTCTITVRDNGIGIAPAELARIKTASSGHGYGYEIANALAVACSAELSIESQRNSGTKVTLTLVRESSDCDVNTLNITRP